MKTEDIILHKLEIDPKFSRRLPDVVLARQLYCFIERYEKKVKLKTIGANIGLEYSTVIRHVERFKGMLDVGDEQAVSLYNDFKYWESALVYKPINNDTF